MSSPQPLLLTEVYCHVYDPQDSAAYVCFDNTGTTPVPLTDWALLWNGARLRFPAGAAIAPGASCYIAWSASGFAHELTRSPNFAIGPATDVATLQPDGAAPAPLDSAQGTVGLIAPDGTVADSVAWGSATPAAGWNGPPLPAPARGQLLQRAIDEAALGPESSGTFLLVGSGDASGTAWRQGTDWMPRRQAVVGQGRFPYPSFAAKDLVTFVTPDCAYATIGEFLDRATQRLDICLYELTQQGLLPRIEAARQRGVGVRLLLEGRPVGGFPASYRQVIEQLQSLGVEVRINHAAGDGFQRYIYVHAKYAVADGQHCLIMSDNWSHESTPDKPQTGLRGWGVTLESPELASYLEGVFTFDWNPASPDSQVYNTAHVVDEINVPPDSAGTTDMLGAPEAIAPDRAAPLPIPDPVQPATFAGPVTITPFLAPQHALLATRAISGLLRSATQRLDIQQMGVEYFWGPVSAGSPETTPNLFLAEVLAAARRGVRVRLLLDAAFVRAGATRDNGVTQRWLQDLIARESLPLEVRLLDYQRTHMGIHNKGVIVDERWSLVSSINWSQNSPLSNRELGLILASPEVAQYYGRVFDSDWQQGQ